MLSATKLKLALRTSKMRLDAAAKADAPLRFYQRRLFKYTVGGIALSPVAAGLGIWGYIEYRQKTRPADVAFRPLVDADGTLRLKDITIAPPTNWTLFLRVLELILIFLPLAITYVWMSRNKESHLRWLHQFVAAVENAGPAFIKAGQWTCTRKDLFGDDFRKVFEKLYSDVKIHPIEDTYRVIAEDLKQDPREIFDKIEEVPCGSGSIGQVHIAQLKGSTEKCVIKVMHPNVVETIATDFWIINGTARFIDKYFSSFERYDVVRLALAFTNHLAAQLDFRIEAENLELFREHFKDVDYVEFPRPLFSTMRVLVETYASGEAATPEFLGAQEEHVREILAGKGLNTWCKMLLRDNFVHGDMHPGNILIDTTDPHNPKVTMIDVGLCQKLDHATESPLVFNLMSSFVHWNDKLCCETLLAMGTEQKFAEAEPFKAEMAVHFAGFRSKRSSEVKDKQISNILENIFNCIRDHRVMMDPPFVSLLFAVLVLESFIMSLNPEFNMVRHSAPWLVSEGHINKSLVKHVLRSRRDLVLTKARKMRFQLRDKIMGEQPKEVVPKNARISSEDA